MVFNSAPGPASNLLTPFMMKKYFANYTNQQINCFQEQLKGNGLSILPYPAVRSSPMAVTALG